MTLPAKPPKRNPNDTTFRNLNALKVRVAKLEKLVAYLASCHEPKKVGAKQT
jgi:hypothetical protein